VTSRPSRFQQRRGIALAVMMCGGAVDAMVLPPTAQALIRLFGWRGALLDRFFAARVSFVLLSMAALGTFLLAGAQSLQMGELAAVLIGFGMGGEADVIPYMLSRYFGLRSFATLYGLTWTAVATLMLLAPRYELASVVGD